MRRLLIALVIVFSLLPLPTSAAPDDPRFFPQTGFRIDNDAFFDYFLARGGIQNFGYPVSRVFTLNGVVVQIFQRRVVQLNGDGSVTQINLLDPEFLPYTSFNNAVFPASDAGITSSAPTVGSPGYAQAVVDFVRQVAPESVGGFATRFFSTFQNTVPFEVAFPLGGDPGLLLGIDLEMWGVPTSRPAADPNNGSFVYQRFQRGIMHFDAGCNCTQGILLGDYFKSVLTGQNLPSDLAAEAANSPYFKQYDNSKGDGVANPAKLANSNLKNAFEKETVAPTPPTGVNGLRYGFAVHMPFQDQQRIVNTVKDAGYGWIKQQIRWADMQPDRGTIRWYLMDPIADRAAANGVGVLFSINGTPAWARADKQSNGPPDDLNDLGNFLFAMARRYQGKVQAYEIWNEQNFSREWGGGTINAGGYIEMLRVAHARIKQGDPNAIVVSGALTPTGVNDPSVAVDDATYLGQMYAYQGGVFKQLADAVGAHAAGYNNAPEDTMGNSTTGTVGFKDHPSFYFRRIDDLHNVMAQNGDGRPMFITEYEWGAAQPPVPAGYEWTTQLSEAQVGDFYVRGIQMIQRDRPWVGAVFVWNLNLRIIKNYHDSEEAIFGVLNPDWSPRSIYTKLAAQPK